MAKWSGNVLNKKGHHKNACWQQNRQGKGNFVWSWIIYISHSMTLSLPPHRKWHSFEFCRTK